jgi:nitrous oxide reductase
MKKNIDRREFLKRAGAAGIITAGLGSIAGCKSATGETAPQAGEGGMTYRTNPGNGDVVSILGYGCMR